MMMRYGIISATKTEIMPLLRKWQVSSAALHAADDVFLAPDVCVRFFNTGIGEARVERTLMRSRTLIQACDTLFFVGICGGIDAHYRSGDVLRLTSVSRFSYDITCGVWRREETLSVPGEADEKQFHGATVSFPLGVEEKKVLYHTDASLACVDMEAFSVIRFIRDQCDCRPTQVLKGVSDSADLPIPAPETWKKMRAKSFIARSLFCLRHPFDMFTYMRFQRGAERAINAVCRKVVTIFVPSEKHHLS
jgi:nucleoside phosphorylase